MSVTMRESGVHTLLLGLDPTPLPQGSSFTSAVCPFVAVILIAYGAIHL